MHCTYLTVLHHLSDFDSKNHAELDDDMQKVVRSLKDRLQHQDGSDLPQLRQLLFDFVSQNTKFQFYFGFHSVSTRNPIQLLAPFPDSYSGSGSLAKIVKQMHTDHGSKTATIVVATHHQKPVMQQFEALVVDFGWLYLENTINLTTGGGRRPSDEMIAAAHSRVKSWMEGQSALWMEKATQLYAEHENSKIKKKIGYSSPEDIYKANSKKQQKKQDIIPI